MHPGIIQCHRHFHHLPTVTQVHTPDTTVPLRGLPPLPQPPTPEQPMRRSTAKDRHQSREDAYQIPLSVPQSWQQHELGQDSVITLQEALRETQNLRKRQEDVTLALYGATHRRDTERVAALLTRLHELDLKINEQARLKLGVEIPERIEFEKLRAQTEVIISGRALIGVQGGNVLGGPAGGGAAAAAQRLALDTSTSRLNARITTLEDQVARLELQLEKREKEVEELRTYLNDAVAKASSALDQLDDSQSGADYKNAVRAALFERLLEGRRYMTYHEVMKDRERFSYVPIEVTPTRLLRVVSRQLAYLASLSALPALAVQTGYGETVLTLANAKIQQVEFKDKDLQAITKKTASQSITGPTQDAGVFVELVVDNWPQRLNMPLLTATRFTNGQVVAQPTDIRFETRIHLGARVRLAIGLLLVYFMKDQDTYLLMLQSLQEIKDVVQSGLRTIQEDGTIHLKTLYDLTDVIVTTVYKQDSKKGTEIAVASNVGREILLRVLRDQLGFRQTLAESERELRATPEEASSIPSVDRLRLIRGQVRKYQFDVANLPGEPLTLGDLEKVGTWSQQIDGKLFADPESFFLQLIAPPAAKGLAGSIFQFLLDAFAGASPSDKEIQPDNATWYNVFETIRLLLRYVSFSEFTDAVRKALVPVTDIASKATRIDMRLAIPMAQIPNNSEEVNQQQWVNYDAIKKELSEIWTYSTLPAPLNGAPDFDLATREIRIRLFGYKKPTEENSNSTVPDGVVTFIRSRASPDDAVAAILEGAAKTNADSYRNKEVTSVEPPGAVIPIPISHPLDPTVRPVLPPLATAIASEISLHDVEENIQSESKNTHPTTSNSSTEVEVEVEELDIAIDWTDI